MPRSKAILCQLSKLVVVVSLCVLMLLSCDSLANVVIIMIQANMGDEKCAAGKSAIVGSRCLLDFFFLDIDYVQHIVFVTLVQNRCTIFCWDIRHGILIKSEIVLHYIVLHDDSFPF